jgi:hypothetical protein
MMAMGKRSNLPRIPRDRYETPRAPVLRLIPYLRRYGVVDFVEPCDGRDGKGNGGALIGHLEAFGFRCVYSGDIATGQDALLLTAAMCHGAPIISNLPYKYPEDHDRSTRLLRDLITHFLDIGAVSYLLMKHDWINNRGAAKFMKRCSDIIVTERVCWIPGTSNGGMENACWCRFDPRYRGEDKGSAYWNNRDTPQQVWPQLPRLKSGRRHDTTEPERARP